MYSVREEPLCQDQGGLAEIFCGFQKPNTLRNVGESGGGSSVFRIFSAYCLFHTGYFVLISLKETVCQPGLYQRFGVPFAYFVGSTRICCVHWAKTGNP